MLKESPYYIYSNIYCVVLMIEPKLVTCYELPKQLWYVHGGMMFFLICVLKKSM